MPHIISHSKHLLPDQMPSSLTPKEKIRKTTNYVFHNVTAHTHIHTCVAHGVSTQSAALCALIRRWRCRSEQAAAACGWAKMGNRKCELCFSANFHPTTNVVNTHGYIHICACVLTCRTHVYRHKLLLMLSKYACKLLVESTNNNARARLFSTGCLQTANNKNRTPCRPTRTHASTCTQALTLAAMVRQPPSLHSLPTTTNQKICLRIVAKKRMTSQAAARKIEKCGKNSATPLPHQQSTHGTPLTFVFLLFPLS